MICNKELLVAYLYDELERSERRDFERHIASCAVCRDEVQGLGATRAHLGSWASPEQHLEIPMIRRPSPAHAVKSRISPAWGLAAAAVLVMALASAIANLEVRAGGEGLVIRTGWNTSPAAPAPEDVSVPPAILQAQAELDAIHTRLNELEALAAARLATDTTTSAAADDVRTAQADVLRLVRQLIEQSETRQQRELAIRVGQVVRDLDNARLADFARIQQGLAQIQGRTDETFIRQQRMEHSLYRAVQQQER